jgi:large subunit ribosomal protein L10
MENLPAKQLQQMRQTLRDTCVIRMTKRRLIKVVFDKLKEEKKGVEQLKEHLKGMPALIFTKENPFKLHAMLHKSKSKAPAKAGQTAPMDIVVPAGPTPFAPGPIISELGGVGIKAGIEGGKVVIKEDSTVCKEGEQISPEAAGILTRLGIEPMEIGLDLVATFENGTIFTSDVLAVDEEEFRQKFISAHSWAFNLAVETAFPTAQTIGLLISKAFSDSKALALSQDIMTDATAKELLAKAESQASSLKSQLKV